MQVTVCCQGTEIWTIMICCKCIRCFGKKLKTISIAAVRSHKEIILKKSNYYNTYMQLETWVDLLLIITFLYFSLYPFESPEIKCKQNYD